MEKLHPKAVWLFFFKFLKLELPLFFVFIWFGVIALSQIAKAGEMLMPFWLFILFFLATFAILAFNYLWAVLSWRFYQYELTQDSLKIERGVIWKHYVSIPYERIQNVDICRGIVARILRLSELLIHTAGVGGSPRGEGHLPGVLREEAERLREELIQKVKGAKQGL